MFRVLAASVTSFHENEEGHVAPAVGSLVAAIGAILLGIGSANDGGALALTGGIVLAVGIRVYTVMHHRLIDYGNFRAIDKLNGK